MERRLGAPLFVAFATLIAAAVIALASADAGALQKTVAQQAAPSPTASASAQPAPQLTVTPYEPPMFPGIITTPPPPGVTETPSVPPTQPPIIVEPPSAGVTPGGTLTLRVLSVLGVITVTVADPTIVDFTVNQDTRTVTIVGRKLGFTTMTVRDERGLTRDVGIRVAENAGVVASNASVRITGHPATAEFIRETALAAALAALTTKPGATIVAPLESISVPGSLRPDNVINVDVPIIVQGGDAYFTVQGTTHVRVENFAQPAVAPKQLLVSDYPETLRENGTLFTADLTPKSAERFLYYHYNPAGQPDRRLTLHVSNPAPAPAMVQLIAGTAGPGVNEMEVGHNSTQRFLVHRAQDEGTVITLPPNSTTVLLDQSLPAKTVVSGILQLHEIVGAPLHLALTARNADDPLDAVVGDGSLLAGDHPHARGVYPIPEFYFDYSYDAEGPDLNIAIGQLPLPNLVEGQTLGGDYGVLQAITIRLINNDRHNARNIALYADPRGGRATGTFVIDRVLVQAHAMAPFSHYKLRQYVVPPGGYVRTEIVTMPEGGSSYPLSLVVAPDDGSVPPGASDSPIY